MVRRFFWVCPPLLLVQVSWANDAAWTCQQDKNSKEWVCVGDKKSDPIGSGNDNNTVIKSKPMPAQVTESPQPKADTASQLAAPRTPEIPAIKAEMPVAPPTDPIPTSVAPAAARAPEIKEISPNPNKPTAEPAAANQSIEPASPAVTQSEAVSNIPVTPAPSSIITGQDVKNAPSETVRPETHVAKSTEPSGWHCGANGEKEVWDCKLVGADPKGKPKAVKPEDTGFGWRLLDPVFSQQEENIFGSLNDRFPVDPWQNCSVELTTQQKKIKNKDEREAAPIDMNSNYSEIFDNEVGSYFGNVDIKRADQRASSHAAHYDTVADVLDLHGNVFYSEDEIGLYTDSATLKLASDEARLRDALFISPTTPVRGRAKAVYRDNQFLSRYLDAAYTSCRPGNQDWAVHASELKLNKETGKGAAKNAWVEFKGLPVFYSPYLSFPIDDRRMTGFLAPVFGNTRSSGFDFSTPFYWNLAPNYDATLRPRYLTERGILLAGDFRYLTENSKGGFSAEFMPNDSKEWGNKTDKNDPNGRNPNYGKSRYQFSFDNTTRFTPNIASNIDLNYVSDKNYFSDLGNSLSFSNFRYVRSTADISYIDDDINLTAQAVSYQRVDETVAGPYRKLPQINLALDHAFENLPIPITTELDSEFVYFQKSDLVLPKVDSSGDQLLNPISKDPLFNTTAYPESQRFNIQPSVSLPWKTDAGYLTPKASFQYTQYFLNNQWQGVKGSDNEYQKDANGNWLKNSVDSVSRALPILSVDSGLYLERDVDLVGTKLKHTLEPRLFYLYIPRTNQDNIPLFDTNIYDFRFNSMFRENRFSGTDRVQDANQITLALTSRLLDSETGKERLKLNIGNILYLQNRDVTLANLDQNGQIRQTRAEKTAFNHQTFSNVVTEVTGQLNDHFSFDSGLQWNPRTNHIERGSIGLHFVNRPGELINLGFQFRKDDSRCRSSDAAIPAQGKPATQGCGYLVNTATAADLADPNSPNNPNNSVVKQDIITSDASFRWPIYDDWYGIGRWQYSWLYGRTQEAFLGLEKETCCWRFRVIGRRYFNGITNTNNFSSGSSSFNLDTAQAQNGIFFQIELKSLTGLGQKLDEFFERNIYGYQSTTQ